MSRLDEIDDWLNHEPCCDHAGADQHGCWDCLNTGHTHGSTITFEDAQALVKFAKAVEVALETPIGDDLEHDDHVYLEWAYNRIDMVQAALNELEQDA